MLKRKILFIVLLLFILLLGEITADTYKKDLLVPEHTPNQVIESINAALEDYNIESFKDYHLMKFLSGSDAILTYDITALPLIESGADYHFYPLYTDIIVIGVDKDIVVKSINSWEDIKHVEEEVSLPEDDFSIKSIWATLSYSYIKEIKNNVPVNYLKKLNDENRLYWDNEDASIQISFISALENQISESKNFDIIIPKEGTLSFKLGILSHEPIDERSVEALRKSINPPNFIAIGDITDGIFLQKDFLNMGQLLPIIRQKVLGERKYGPAGSQSHQLVSIILIIFIAILTAQSQRQVIHKGVKRGLLITGLLLIGWISLGIFKYILFGYTPIAHISWYSYYIFSLSLPILSLIIAENSDKVDDTNIPNWLQLSGAVSIIFMVLVLTNDYHQWIFRFLTDIPELRGDEYTYGFGFTLLSIWYIASTFYSFFLMLKKGWDSPKRNMTIIPMIVFILGIIYSISYNMRIRFASDFPLMLGMSLVTTLFWGTAVYSGLIPTNRGYRALFEGSNLDMQIADNKDNIIFNAAESTVLLEKLKGMFIEKVSFQKEDKLIWSTPINGGKVITWENIRQLNELKKTLEETASTLENENIILSKKEQVESRLIILNEQNRLSKEVDKLIKDKLKEIDSLLNDDYNDKYDKENALTKIHILAICCKRESELLIKSKRHETLPAQELCRIIQEIAGLLSENIYVFCAIDDMLTYKKAADIYEYFHKIIDITLALDIKNMTIRMFKKESNYCIYILLEESTNEFYSEFKRYFIDKKETEFTKKELDGTISVTLMVKGEEK